MPHHNTVFVQMLKFIPTCLSRQGHEFESLAHQHHSGRRLRKMTRWTQFVAMATAQLSDCTCLQQAGWMPQPSTCVSRCFLRPHAVPCFGGLSNHQGRLQAACRAGSRGYAACLQQAGRAVLLSWTGVTMIMPGINH